MNMVYCLSRYNMYVYTLFLNYYTFIIYNNYTIKAHPSLRSIVITAIKCMIIHIQLLLCVYRLHTQYIPLNLLFHPLSICTIKAHYQATSLIITIQKSSLTYQPNLYYFKGHPLKTVVL